MTKKLQDTVDQNSKDICDIKNSIDVIKNNHLHHIEADMLQVKNNMRTMDTRLWAILLILVASTVVGGIVSMIGM